MGQHPSKDKLTRSASERLPDRERFGRFGKRASSKKREIGVTQVLTPSKLSPRNPPNTNGEAKKISRTSLSTAPTTQTKTSIDKKSIKEKDRRLKDCSRVTGKGGRVSPGTRPPQQQVINKTPPRTTEALAVLVHHLVYNLDAFQTPSLRRQVEGFRAEIEQTRQRCQQLEESLDAERNRNAHIFENELTRNKAEITEMAKQHHQTILQLNEQHAEVEQFLKDENVKLQNLHEHELHNVKIELNKLQNTHEETLNILREENCAIREEMDEKNAIIRNFKDIKLDFDKFKKEYDARELVFKEQLHLANEENKNLKIDNERIYTERFEGNNSLQEIQSLRAVLELKQAEVAELRTCLAKVTQKVEILPSTLDKVQGLTSRCEDLQLQLKRKTDVEIQLREGRSKMDEIVKEEINQKKRFQQHNEELKYKLKQLTEVLNRVVEQKEDTSFNRSYLSMSYNERHNMSRPRFDRAISLRETSQYGGNSFCNSYQSIGDDFDIDSRPSSPKVKGIVEKYDSVSYVLEMDDNPDIIANRIVRRSFRNSNNTKSNKITSSTTSSSSSSNKRPRMKINSTSSGGDAIDLIEDCWDSRETTHSSPTHKLDIDESHDLEIDLPTLPSEIGKKKNDLQLLPEPKHLASDNITSDSNSEDESSSTGNL